MFKYSIALLATLATPVVLVPEGGRDRQAEVRFNRDVRPILADRCFACHGPDAKARKAKLRLDTREGALAAREAGAAVVPGDPEASLLIQRVRHADAEERMPPRAKGERLTDEEIATLTRWVEQGARWEGHWAFEPIGTVQLPARPSAFIRNDVDRLLAQRIAEVGMRPAPPADARDLIRRLYFDLIGLPPTPGQVREFVADPSDARFEEVVDDLLASEQHAERLAMYWLDLVRYADTSGIHGDQDISMSPYRDWVIRSFHENKPFDVFTRQQLAGDLLPDPSIQDRVASGYNRLNMKTSEGGAQPEEYLAKYAADRVRTTATVWLGLTLGCAECHDHKFDPFTTRDFYRFAAFFADLDQKGFYPGSKWTPKIAVPSQAQEKEHGRLMQRVEELERLVATHTPELSAAQAQWEEDTKAAVAKAQRPLLGPWSSIGPFKGGSNRGSFDKDFGPEKNPGSELLAVGELAWVARPSWKDGGIHKLVGDNSATYIARDISTARAQPLELSLGSDDAIKVWLNGDIVLSKYVSRGVARDQEKVTVNLREGRNRLLMKVTNGTGGYGFYFNTRRSGPPLDIVEILKTQGAARSSANKIKLAAYYRTVAPTLAAARADLSASRSRLGSLEAGFVTTLVSKVRAAPRVTRILPRGDWQSKDGDVVTPGVPESLPGSSINSKSLNRLDLANWVVHPDNPLTARVFVNRLWKLYFGHGLSRDLGDLGTQGDRPRQDRLLEWLAAQFREGWDIRRMIKLMVMSSAYRQSSVTPAAAIERDPDNREFARQGRYRHDAEVVRDFALSVSGLLNREVGGKSVKPYQPAGYWRELNFPKRKWVHDTGDAQYRRGLYTHWQRTFLHPSLRAFDAPSREECTAERPRSNTPLQALALLNDPTYVEAARVLAARTVSEGGAGFEARLRWTFQQVLARDPDASEEATLRALFDAQRERYESDRGSAEALTGVGLAAQASGIGVIEHASWIAIARVLLNLHETVTRY